MRMLEQSDSEPDQIYFKRKQRAKKLEAKEEQQVHILEEIFNKDEEKHRTLGHFMRLFFCVKQSIKGIRSDYYSNKVFNTLHKTPNADLKKITKVLYEMLQSIMCLTVDPEMIRKVSPEEDVDERLIEFLIIPRFLISKDKLLKISTD